MKDERAFESLLIDALRRRGAPPPFAIDVADRVMARVAALGPPPRNEMGFRQFAWWAIAASVVGATLTTAAVRQGPSLAAVVSYLGHAITGAADAVAKLQSPAGTLVGTLGRVVLAFVSSARVLVQTLHPLEPLAQAALAATAAAMLIVTTLVVSRDVRARVAKKEEA